MAEEGKKPNISIWLYIGAAVAVVAILVLLRRRPTGASFDTGTSTDVTDPVTTSGGSNARPTGTGGTDYSGNPATQTLPYPQLVTNTSNVWDNTVTVPTNTPVTPPPVQVIPTPTPVTPPPTPQQSSNTLTVLAGWHVDQWLADLHKQGYNTTYADLVAANPGLVPNIGWDPTGKVNYFKAQQKYTVPPQDMPLQKK